MSQINLVSGGEEMNRPAKGSLGSSFFLSVSILVLTFGAYFGSMYYSNSLSRSVASYEQELESKKSLVVGDKANRIADFADRLDVVGGNLKETSSQPNDPLLRIERSMMPDVNLSSYSFDLEGKKVKVSLSADSFRSVAQQIVAFKKDNTFSGVAIDGSVATDDQGKISADLDLSL